MQLQQFTPKIIFTVCMLLLISGFTLQAQDDFYKTYPFTEADTLRGMLRPERTAYDVTFYELNIKIDPEQQFIEGYVDVFFDAVEDFDRLQIDLYKNMEINSIIFNDKVLDYERQHNAVFIDFPKQKKGTKSSFRVNYEGKPRAAKNPPWDGGFVWKKDKNGAHWIGVACEGDGASLWWPNKDHLSDEPDSMSIKIAVPEDLICVANGNLRNKEELRGGYMRYDWWVSYPINNYNVTVNIANYAHISDTYEAFDGEKLDLDYYVLTYNEKKATEHFKQTHKVLACFERYFGKYPFWKDGFAMVETPYLGMEHQGAIAYGNQYKRGYLGGMIPRDMNWDYIIVHETAHEYFGNSISVNDHAEMWIHESFATYMEALYVECVYSYQDALRYLASQRFFISNREPMLGPLNVNWTDFAGSDHYYKGAMMLNTLRHAINDDELWFDCLYSFHQRYAISQVETADFVNYVEECTKKDFKPFFEQYLKYPKPPTLLVNMKKVSDKSVTVQYKWDADVKDFSMPVAIGKQDEYEWVYPNTKEWKETKLKIGEGDFRVATELFYIRVKEAKPDK